MADFDQSAKGGRSAKFPKSAILMADWTLEGSKNRKYLMDFGLISMDGAEFIQVSIDTKNSKKKPFTVAEITMFPLKTFSEIECASNFLQI